MKERTERGRKVARKLGSIATTLRRMKMTRRILKLAVVASIYFQGFAAADDALRAQPHVVRASTNRIRIVTPAAIVPAQSTFDPGPPLAPRQPIRPSSTFLPQSGTFSRPEGTFSRPESTFSRPQTTFERPASTFERAGTTFERPRSTFERPRGTFHHPSGAYHQPVTVYIPAPPTIIVEPVIISGPATEAPAETVQVAPEPEAPAPPPEPVIVLDLPPGAKIVKPAPTAQ